MSRSHLFALTPLLIAGMLQGPALADGLTPKEQLGKQLFFDNLSDPSRVSCSSCHSPETGWTGPVAGINRHGGVYRGAIPVRFGGRKPPSAAYATQSPVFGFSASGRPSGGNFWDGRATGEKLGNPAADQAQGPFLNPVEQNNPDPQSVCFKVMDSDYAQLFDEAWGEPLDCYEGLALTYDRIGLAIAAYEASSEVNQFSSKYDRYLDGDVELTAQEAEGLQLFQDVRCSACHRLDAALPLFTSFGYANIGTPRNPDNPFYDMDRILLDDGTPINPLGRDWVDLGLGGFLATRPDYEDRAMENDGKYKFPTLRNVAKGFGKGFPKTYGHNGYFKSLEGIVHFYNTRDVKAVCPDNPKTELNESLFTSEQDALRMDCWPEPEVNRNLTAGIVGNLGLTPEEEDAIVAFLQTLSDGFEEVPRGPTH
ncbi:MAG: cytochrome C [Oceanospirillaceae bacterium]|nr:cytochrome C [Oceanospirillaceae bacterium]